MTSDSHDQRVLLLLIGTIYALLHDAASMHVACDSSAISIHSVVDKLLIGVRPRVQDLLEDVIAIDLTSQGHEIIQKVFSKDSLVM